jgi:hypothetical protein
MYTNGEQDCHAIEVIRTRGHLQNSRDNRRLGPFSSKFPRQTLQIDRRSLTNGINGVTQPIHGQLSEFLVEEGDAKLFGEERDLSNDG